MKSVLFACCIFVFAVGSAMACDGNPLVADLSSCPATEFKPPFQDLVPTHVVTTMSVDPARVAARPPLPQPDTVVRTMAESK